MTPLLTDRTTIETDWTCGQKRFWYKHAGGTGIVPTVEASYYAEGRAVHEDMARAFQGDQQVPEDLWAALPPREAGQVALEPAWRRLGWAIAAREWWTKAALTDRVVRLVETELVLDRGDLWVASTADAVLEITAGAYAGQLEVIDFKSTRDAGIKWQLHWPYAVQMHLQIKAVEEELQQPVAWLRVVGLMKGQERYGRLYHPYVYAYRNSDGTLFNDYRTGLEAAPVWEHFDSLDSYRAYVLGLGIDTGMAQFPSSHPVFLNQRLLDGLIAERQIRERQVRDGMAVGAPLNAIFESRFHECRPAFGDQCPYLAACHNAEVNANPIGSGLYVPRTPHHELETMMLHGDID